MCGITGFFGVGDEEILRRMTNSISYRGPDDAGYFFNDKIGLGHRRLSIIDLTDRARQPMWNEDKTVATIFNGEIYNYKELKKDLIGKGHEFISESDTEVLVHGYEEYGENIILMCDGMFALAIYDIKNETLVLARDRFGKKPLYFFAKDGNVVFASETKALLKHPLISKKLNPEAVNYYMFYEYVPHPYSIYNDISCVEPSTFLLFKKGILKKKICYWDLKNIKQEKQSYERVLENFEKLFSDSVKKRLISDVPLGIFLSGGIDSSSVAFYAQKHSIEPIHTFSVGFNEQSFDESFYARLVAKHIGSRHHEEKVSVCDALNVIPEIFSKLDEPLGDASLIPTYMVSRMTRRDVTVALGGDGGDELLFGYPTFYAQKLRNFLRFLPKTMISWFFLLSKKIPVSDKYFSFGFKLHRFMRGWNESSLHQDQLWRGSFNTDERKQLFSKNFYQNIKDVNGFNPIDIAPPNNNETFLQKLSYIYCSTYLADDILVKVDRASMYNSLEVRAPFLDYKLAEFLFSLPDDFKLKGKKEKWILHELMKDKLPKKILLRSKKGFALPIAQWLRNELKCLGDEFFNESFLKQQGIFNQQYINMLWKRHQSCNYDYRKELWTLLAFQLWYKNNL